jgi:YbbR domain-containing protein
VNWRQVIQAIEPYPRENFRLKAIALLLALLMWVGVNSVESELQIIPDVPVEIVNLPDELAVANDWEGTIDVRLRGSAQRFRDIRAGQIGPRIDLSDARAGENIISLSAEDLRVPLGTQVESIVPRDITVVLEERVVAAIPISSVVEGEPATGYEVAGKILNPSTAWVSGPRSRVDDLDHVQTQMVNVAGRKDSFTQVVALRSGDPFIDLTSDNEAELTIVIQERAINMQYDGVPVAVVNSEFRVDINPQEIGVVISGPPSILEDFTIENFVVEIDAAGLDPRADDYLIEPRISFQPEILAESLSIIALTPQRRINVHVYPTPAQRDQ